MRIGLWDFKTAKQMWCHVKAGIDDDFNAVLPVYAGMGIFLFVFCGNLRQQITRDQSRKQLRKIKEIFISTIL